MVDKNIEKQWERDKDTILNDIFGRSEFTATDIFVEGLRKVWEKECWEKNQQYVYNAELLDILVERTLKLTGTTADNYYKG